MIYKTLNDVPPDVFSFMEEVVRAFYDNETSGGCHDLSKTALLRCTDPQHRQDFLDTYNQLSCDEIDPEKSDQVIENFDHIPDFSVFWLYRELVKSTYQNDIPRLQIYEAEEYDRSVGGEG